tara:strand:+ start:1107 stop:2153 length:1047 start_codon:yes stop_codon:yes gene_type:complete
MALSEDIQDAITRHQIFILRYSSGREKEAAKYIDEISEAIKDELRNEELTDFDLQRLNKFFDEVQAFANEKLGELGQKILDDAGSLLEQELEWNQSLLGSLINSTIKPASSFEGQLAVFAGLLYTGGAALSIRSIVNMFKRSKTRQVLQDLRDGVTLRENNQQITERVDRHNPLQKKQAGSLIRTVNNYVSVQTRNLVLRDNIDLFDGYEWVSILDSRTSIICASRDGKIYPLTDDPIKSPKPPAHFSCRSTIAPRVKPGVEGKVKKKEQRKAVGSKGEKKVRQTTTYESWLRRQSASFQDIVLGPSRGRLFRRGGLAISKFVDASGKTLTLDELRKVEPEVFNRVKL